MTCRCGKPAVVVESCLDCIYGLYWQCAVKAIERENEVAELERLYRL